MQDLNDLYYFAMAAKHGGFAPAGRALGIAKSKLSRRVGLLEKRLDTRLIHRSTRRFNLTTVGQRYLEHCQAMLEEARAAQDAIDEVKAEPRGTLRMTCPVGLLNFHVGEMLADFLAQYPRVTIQLEATNRRVDVVAEGIDLAVRVRPLPLEDSRLLLRTLSDRGQRLVAHPDLVERMGLPQAPADLVSWPSLHRGTAEEQVEWCLSNADGQEVRVPHQPRYFTTDMLALKAAALAGAGVVQLPELMLRDELARGELVTVLPDWRPRREMIHIVFPSRRGMLPAVRTLIDYIAKRYAGIDED